MKNEIDIILDRGKEVLKKTGFSQSTLTNKIRDGLWCPPVSLGERAVGYPRHETDALLAAFINAYTLDEIRLLVKMLLDARPELLDSISQLTGIQQ